MMIRPVLARVSLLLSRRSGFAPFCELDAALIGGMPSSSRGASMVKPPLNVWMSTSRDDNKFEDDSKLTSVAGTRSDLTRRTQHQPASRAMFLGNIASLLADVGGIVLAGISVALGLLYFQQDKLLYIPEIQGLTRPNESNPAGYKSPAEYDIPFETHMIKTSDGNAIHSWLLLHPDSKQQELPTIMFFHGNAGNIGIRLPNAVEMYNLKANVFLVEYRGYGDSSPNVKPSEDGIKRDCESALRFISNHPRINSSKLFVFGRSLGGAVAFHVARYAETNKIPLAGLIIENTFISVDRMVDVLLPFLSPVKSLLLRIHYDSSKIVPQLQVPILFLAGDADEIVPHSQMLELYESSGSSSSATLNVVKGGMHNDTWLQGGKAYWNAIRDFINGQ